MPANIQIPMAEFGGHEYFPPGALFCGGDTAAPGGAMENPSLPAGPQMKGISIHKGADGPYLEVEL